MALGPNKFLHLMNVRDTLGPQELVRQIMKFLCGEHTQEGPDTAWTIVEADDGTIRSVPSGGGGLSNLSSSNLWHPSHDGTNLPVNSWCVIESADSESPGGEHFQMLLHVVNSTTLQGYLFPLADHTTSPGASASGLPSLPTHYDAGVAWTFSSDSPYTVFVSADEGKAVFGYTDRYQTLRWWYIGEVTFFGDTVGGRDLTRRYVIRNVQHPYPSVSSAENTEWSVWDDEQQQFFTSYVYEVREYHHAGGDLSQRDSTRGTNAFGAVWFSQYGITYFGNDGQSVFGYLRDVYVCNGGSHGMVGQTYDKKIIWHFGSSAFLLYTLPVAAFGWDGETSFPPDTMAA
jgi:hypothetical protein